ncbi:MAG: 2'-5' RNA ligase family protein [Planctomycetota bacterium]
MAQKSHHTAVVAIPPAPVWEPVQAIRRVHDRQIGRWMPHVTLLYPFLPPDRLDETAPGLLEACRGLAPVETALREFCFFRHRRGATIWLAPEPKEKYVRLQAAIQKAFPGHDDVSRHRDGFTPHLSVGQTDAPEALAKDLQKGWTPLEFTLANVAVIRREGDTPFEVVREIPLGSTLP